MLELYCIGIDLEFSLVECLSSMQEVLVFFFNIYILGIVVIDKKIKSLSLGCFLLYRLVWII